MRTELDGYMDAVMGSLTAEGGPLALRSVERFGVRLPMIAAAPPALPQYFSHYCQENAEKTFLVSGDERLSFADVYEQAVQVAHALVGTHGVVKGDRIGIAMRNSPSWIVLYMGILMAGGVATLLNGWWQSEELQAGIDEVECRLVFADAARTRRLGEVTIAAPVVTIDDVLPLAEALRPLTSDVGAEVALPEIAPEDVATILFTSGSTGRSKGAVADHRSVVQATFNYLGQIMMLMGIAQQTGLPIPQGQPSTLLNIPLFHVTAEVPVLLQSFAMGRKLVMMPKWDAEEAMRLIQQEGVTYFVGVPLMSLEILNHPRRHEYDLSTVADFAAGGAPRPVEHVRRINEEMGGGSPLIGYGLTETNAAGTGNWRSNYLNKPASAGKPSQPLIDMAILDDAGRPRPSGERGEICIRSICNFNGYWGRPDATAQAITEDGYFRTGDIGYLDEDGYLFIVDRKKDIIIRGGENISCLEVEAALYHHSEVIEAAVFGLADERLGEVPGAVVHLAPGSNLDEQDLRTYLGEHIAAFKVPTRVWVSTEPLPRLGTEKIDKVGLRARYRAMAEA